MSLSRARVACTALSVMVSTTAVADAGACHAASGAAIRPLVELYTSEGCDSCPPADRWLAQRFADPREAPIAIAFHVDYWDRLGWKDRFASPAFTERQHHAADANRATFVYTPQVLLQGRDFRWRDAHGVDAIASAAAQPARASIEVTAEPSGNGVRVHAAARVPDAALRRDATLALAYVDSGLVSEVKAGENRGARLRHDHVVRAFTLAAPARGADALSAQATFAVPAEAGRNPVIVAFVQRAGNGDVLQSLELPLAPCAGASAAGQAPR